MKRKRHSPEQIITKLREADAMLAAGSTLAQVSETIYDDGDGYVTTSRAWHGTGANDYTGAHYHYDITKYYFSD